MRSSGSCLHAKARPVAAAEEFAYVDVRGVHGAYGGQERLVLCGKRPQDIHRQGLERLDQGVVVAGLQAAETPGNARRAHRVANRRVVAGMEICGKPHAGGCAERQPRGELQCLADAGVVFAYHDTPGVERRPFAAISAPDDLDFNEVFLRDATVPAGNLVGELVSSRAPGMMPCW